MKAPSWCKDAKPTTRGWVHPRTGELLSSQKFSQGQVDSFFKEVVVEQTVSPTATLLTEAPIGGKSIESMTKVELEALGRTHGIEIDRREKKATLVDRVKSLLG